MAIFMANLTTLRSSLFFTQLFHRLIERTKTTSILSFHTSSLDASLSNNIMKLSILHHLGGKEIDKYYRDSASIS